mmetsp:Transcript_87236/g.249932  ORF Transcript_87236/g.249932 Transcript_87236/m.249932 type:complete len:234 (+) Transcript_87236:481-1182(+)
MSPSTSRSLSAMTNELSASPCATQSSTEWRPGRTSRLAPRVRSPSAPPSASERARCLKESTARDMSTHSHTHRPPPPSWQSCIHGRPGNLNTDSELSGSSLSKSKASQNLSKSRSEDASPTSCTSFSSAPAPLPLAAPMPPQALPIFGGGGAYQIAKPPLGESSSPPSSDPEPSSSDSNSECSASQASPASDLKMSIKKGSPPNSRPMTLPSAVQSSIAGGNAKSNSSGEANQ